MANECVPYYKPGSDITGEAQEAIIGMRFVSIDGSVDPGWQPEGLKGNADLVGASSTANVVPIVQTGAGEDAVGVAQRDCADGGLVTFLNEPGMVLPVRAGAAIVPGAAVQSDATGRAITLAAGVRLGRAWSRTTAADQIVAVELD